MNALSVSAVTSKIKNLLEGEIGEVWIRGEVSSLRPSANGHVYFNLKDTGATLSCAFFRNVAMRTKFRLEEGMELLALGRISVYAPRGNYQLIIEMIEPVGVGALQLAFEQLKAKLEKEGLFAPGRKKSIPKFPRRVAVITSPTGAAVHDFLTVLKRRNPGIEILVVPTLVQGDEAPAQICRAVETVNRLKLADVIVLTRGGGSLEDLWCFNDEAVVRAVGSSLVPVISAIGHEVDFTLSDFVSDLRAPTPSAAAEILAQSTLELQEKVSGLSRRLSFSMQKRLLECRRQLDRWTSFMIHQVTGKIQRHRQTLQGLASGLEALSPLKVLGRGYTLVKDEGSGHLLKSSKETRSGQAITIVFHDGKTNARVEV